MLSLQGKMYFWKNLFTFLVDLNTQIHLPGAEGGNYDV
jgi:hypothetical protein